MKQTRRQKVFKSTLSCLWQLIITTTYRKDGRSQKSVSIFIQLNTFLLVQCQELSTPPFLLLLLPSESFQQALMQEQQRAMVMVN